MKPKIFKPIIAALSIVLLAGSACIAQGINTNPDSALANPPVPVPPLNLTVSHEPLVITTKVDIKALKTQMRQLKVQLKNIKVQTSTQVLAALNNMNVSIDLDNLTPLVSTGFKDLNEISINEGNQEDELTKNFSKTYSVDANDKLAIDNRYGKVLVNTWNRNEIKVDVQIKVSAGNNSDSQKLLDNVNIRDSKEGSNISFRTNIGQQSGSWTSWLRGLNSNHKIEINYTVYMPAKNDLAIDNRYGAIELPDMDGRVTINSSYGSFSARSLSNQSNILVKYGSANIQNLGVSTLEVAYGSLALESANKLDANVSYSSANIGKIYTSGNITVRYSGSLKIENVDRNVRNLTINASYSNVNVGLGSGENANFDVTTHFGGFDYGDRAVTITSKTPDDDKGVHFTKNYRGYFGKGNSEKTISINANYGNVKFE